MSNKFFTNVERYGNYILWRGYDENGMPFSKKVKYQPTLFTKSVDKNTEYKSFIGSYNLQSIKFESISEAKEFIEKYKNISGFDIYGNTNFVSQFIQETYPNDIKFDINLINICSYDIEVDASDGFADIDLADKQITSISYKSSKSNTYYIFTLKDYNKFLTESGIHPDNIHHEKFQTEEDLLLRFIDIWTSNYPDVITGWNVEYFDIMYTVTRIIRLLGEEKARELSPWRSIKKITREIYNKQQSTYHISGISVIDYLDAFKKFGYKYGTQESYKLDHIAYVVLGEKKIDYSEYGSLNELYNKNPQKYFDYSLKDTYLIQRMEDETGLLALVLTVAYSGGVNYSDAFGTVGIWESIIYRKLMSKKLVPPIKSGPGEHLSELIGGYVKDPVVGMHEWIISFDLNSLYPMLMLQYNMSPETYLIDKKENVSIEMVLNGMYKNINNKDYSVCANGVCFTNKVLGIIPEIIEEYYSERKKVKKEMLKYEQMEQDAKEKNEKNKLKKVIAHLHNRQMSIKILMNSLYGAVANRYFLFYISEMAEAITKSGQLSIRYAEMTVNKYLNRILKTKNVDYVVYIDTDSIYVNMAPLIERVFGTTKITREQGEVFLDKVSTEKIEPEISKGYEELAKYMGAYRNSMSMKREKITDKTIFIAKKRYIMNVLNSEGVHYAKPKISVTGVESVRSSTPEICRNKMDSIFEVFMNENESKVQEFIENFRQQFYKLPPEEIAKTSGTDDIEKYMNKSTHGYKSGCPIHVRGCIIYNKFLREKGLDKKYETIKSGDKIKFIYLKLPNPVRENVISFPNVLPKEFGLEKYIDYETQFEKVFLVPIDNILKAVGWNVKKVNSIEDFFV
jgi:DNA polymerase elongation subunit (family B)